MTHLFIFVLALLLSVEANPSPLNTEQHVSPARILAGIKIKGAGVVLAELMKSGDWQTTVLPGIRSAQTDWLQVAKTLYRKTDAGTNEDLDESLFQALLVAPYEVLPKFQSVWWASTETPCTFGYDSELRGGVDQYVKKLRIALGNNAPKKFTSLRDSCIRGIAATLIDVQKHKE